MTAVAAEAAVVVDNGRETSGETSLWHGAAAGAAGRVDPLLRRISGLTRSFLSLLYGGWHCNDTWVLFACKKKIYI